MKAVQRHIGNLDALVIMRLGTEHAGAGDSEQCDHGERGRNIERTVPILFLWFPSDSLAESVVSNRGPNE
jgi:hypothetical protein